MDRLNMRLALKPTIYLLLLALSPSVTGVSLEPDFYADGERGWFWHESYPEENNEEPEPESEQETVVITQPKEQTEKEVALSVEWLRANYPKLRDLALDNPTIANVRRHQFIKRLMMDKSEQFARVSVMVNAFDKYLNEGTARPTHGGTAMKHRNNTRDFRNELITELAVNQDRFGLFFFYESDCDYCVFQGQVLDALTQTTNVEVLAVSLDGSALPNNLYPNFVVDKWDLKSQYEIYNTPSVYLVDKRLKEYHLLFEGVIPLDTVQERIMMLAYREKWISDEEYQATRTVKQLSLTDKPQEQVELFNEKSIFEDDNYLNNRLEQVYRDRYNETSIPVFNKFKKKEWDSER